MIELPKIPLDNEVNTSNAKMEEMIALAHSLKEKQHDFIAIFEVTGLQPEIIQSL
jgi:hypothetical protein